MSAQVHAPYHFVPLSQWVYLPDWAHLVSHDHPFQDGLSGSIKLTLSNKTGLLVGADSEKKNQAPTLVKWARTPDGTLVIPGSSLKGMLRGFLEVATFAKFRQVDDNRYAYRDIRSSKRDNNYSLPVYISILKDTIVQAALLDFDSEKNIWLYRTCQHTRVYGKDLNAYLKTQSIKKSIDNDRQEQSALDKYKIWPLNRPAIAFDFGEHFTQKDTPRTCAVQLGKGDKKGIPVFVGHRPGEGDDLDFNYVFYDVSNSPQAIEAKLVNQMFAAHDEALVQYLKENSHPEYGIPVFIRAKKDENGEIQAIGLAKMPKMLYESSVGDLAKNQQANLVNNSAAFDLCELMFGSLRDYGIGLKSRISFSDSLCTKNTKIQASPAVILGQPKASYLNAYLEQSHNDGKVRGELKMYKKGETLAGWKRYPAKPAFHADLPDDLKNKVNVQSQLELLEPGATFSGSIVFHNLKPVELGALLWAINPDEAFYHGLGHGKSLGAGAVKLQASLELLYCNQGSKPDAQTLIQDFVTHMNQHYPAKADANNWQNSPQIRHLLAFGDLEDNRHKNLTYMPLQKKVAAVTYSNSKSSGSRKALPNWQAGGQALNRKEDIATADTGYAPSGRLSELVDKLVQDGTQLESMKTAIEKRQQEQEQQKMEARKEMASPLFKAFLGLVEHFNIYRGKTGQSAENQVTARHHDLTQLLTQAVVAGSGLSQEELKEMYAQVTDFELTRYFDKDIKLKELSKKAKEKHKEKEALLAQLLTLSA